MANSDFEDYFEHLQKISLAGRLYKRYISSPALLICARHFGPRVIEIGSGTGSGVLGAFPKQVCGLEINPLAVAYCKAAGLNAQLIADDGTFPVADGAYDACILDNVLEHIAHPRRTLDECCRITKQDGGLIIAVPGVRGFESDSDHKHHYDAAALASLDRRWRLLCLFSTPFLFRSAWLSASVKQYCLVAIYKKI